MQDALVIAVAIIAACWLARSLVRRLTAAPCRPPDAPAGSDGFVPLDAIGQPPKRNRGDP